MSTPSILIIDDSEDFRLIVSHVLLDAGYDVWDASCPHDAFSLIKEEKFDLIVCDLHMPFMQGPGGEQFEVSYRVGIETIKELKNLFPETPVIALTSTDPLDIARIRSTLGDILTFSKPRRCSDLMHIVETSLTHAAGNAVN